MRTALTAASEWLASADPDPGRAQLWMSQTRIVMLPLGSLFDAVRVPTDVGKRIVETGIEGPVVRDPRGSVDYFLVPPGTSATWETPEGVADVTCLGPATWLTVPSLPVTAPPGAYWIQAPDGSGLLVAPERLAGALARAVGGQG